MIKNVTIDFSHCESDSVENIIQNLEKRWGLSIASFLQREDISKVQSEVNRFFEYLGGLSKSISSDRMKYFEFLSPEQLHVTHITLCRSSPTGPIQKEKLLTPGHSIKEIAQKVSDASTNIDGIKVCMDRLGVSEDGTDLFVEGRLISTTSTYHDKFIQPVSNSFDSISRLRSRKPKIEENHILLHCTVAFLKRKLPFSYEKYLKSINSYSFDCFEINLNNICLVHHRYRSFMKPHEGIARFYLGGRGVSPSIDELQIGLV
ncbi:MULTISPECIES: hypothetical protein [unclassified Pseudoalteromonas]|uniref:hypothetical protein n=1 Tax=unclassified Pseudoalteromonas TaxID=194690 RepID=UPI0019CFECF0|nr:hypothetical protein [Pseudoalteromonas sp. JC3]MBR8843421.1 hypothetical protein [Pseudoalteromonas sp. JC3]WJE11364.1 hypothetical protein QSH61_19765 [Pseudoalteromonas sp. JC3]